MNFSPYYEYYTTIVVTIRSTASCLYNFIFSFVSFLTIIFHICLNLGRPRPEDLKKNFNTRIIAAVNLILFNFQVYVFSLLVFLKYIAIAINYTFFLIIT